ncbi:MAG: T9SS type A sorting domain-containing protein [Bacteroidetes bacterium]|nr:T9SS type A sorting domain-containing protein [Bacteroidota bacterium]MBL0054531.1 T9SS type A sorting domain-containing protein [Bacteroidota bacterium]
MKYSIVICCLLQWCAFDLCNAQGKTHHFLLGYDVGLFDTNVVSTKARLLIDSNSIITVPESRKMPFGSTQATMSDENGNLIIATNGCWIADATGDTMLNGGGLNPSIYMKDWCDNTSGFPVLHANAILPFPADNSKYILFHHGWDAVTYWFNSYVPLFLYSSLIDISANSGKGEVMTNKKNIQIINDTLSQGIAACKHANGRDWWIVALKDSSDLIYTMLLTPNGIDTIFTQHLNVPFGFVNVWQPQFSPDGKKFSYTFTFPTPIPWPWFADVRIFDFDRCTGIFSNPFIIDISDTYPGMGSQFSSNSKYLYCATQQHLHQIDVATQTKTLVATNDTFYSPYFPFQTDFWSMYRAANGKIYISSGNGVIDMHVINEPDSAGLACDVQLHSLHLPCFQFRANVYHPNYYLGCDTSLGCPCLSSTSLTENGQHDFRFRVYPNPVVNNFVNIGYILPQNKNGILKLYDVNGKQLYSQGLPPWSNEQSIKLPKLANGIYNLRIESGGYFMSRNIVVMRE